MLNESIEFQKAYVKAQIKAHEEASQEANEVTEGLTYHKKGLHAGIAIGFKQALRLLEDLEKEVEKHDQLR